MLRLSRGSNAPAHDVKTDADHNTPPATAQASKERLPSSSAAAGTVRYVAGSRRRDACIFFALACATLATSRTLVVYSDTHSLRRSASFVYYSYRGSPWEPVVVALMLVAAARFAACGGAPAAGSPMGTPPPLPPAASMWSAAATPILFAPINPTVAAAFRTAFATALAVMFQSVGSRRASMKRLNPTLRWLWQELLTPPWWRITLALLIIWGIPNISFLRGGQKRGDRWLRRLLLLQQWVGWLALGLLLPRAFVYQGMRKSRSVLLSSLLSFNLLPLEWHDAEKVVGDDGAKSAAADAGGQTTGPMWPLLLIRLQLSVLYLINAVAKTTPSYLRGDVLIALNTRLPNFLVDFSNGYLDVSDVFPGIPLPFPIYIPVWICAWGTVAVEYALGLLLWHPRLKWLAAILGVSFHMSLKLIMRIGWLDWTCLFLYLAFLLPFERQPDLPPFPLPRGPFLTKSKERLA